MELLIFLGSLFFFMCFGVPLAVVLVLCSIVLMFHSGMWDAMIIPNTMLDGTNNYPLMAIPFFVFALSFGSAFLETFLIPQRKRYFARTNGRRTKRR